MLKYCKTDSAYKCPKVKGYFARSESVPKCRYCYAEHAVCLIPLFYD